MRKNMNVWVRMPEDWVWGIRVFLQRQFGTHGDLKALSLIVSAVVFSLIRLTIGHSETHWAPVHVAITAEGVAILQYSPLEVEVELKGAAEEIRNFDVAELKVRLTIDSTRGNGKEVFKLTRRNVVGAGKLRVVRITPPDVFVEYDPEKEVLMRLSPPELLGRPLQGEATVELLVGEITATGSESQLTKLVEKRIRLPTESVDVSGRTQGFVRRVKVLPPEDSGISYVVPAEVDARVTITIQPPPESIDTNAPMPAATNQLPITSHEDVTNRVKGGSIEAPAPASVERVLPEAD